MDCKKSNIDLVVNLEINLVGIASLKRRPPPRLSATLHSVQSSLQTHHFIISYRIISRLSTSYPCFVLRLVAHHHTGPDHTTTHFSPPISLTILALILSTDSTRAGSLSWGASVGRTWRWNSRCAAGEPCLSNRIATRRYKDRGTRSGKERSAKCHAYIWIRVGSNEMRKEEKRKLTKCIMVPPMTACTPSP